MLRRLGADGDFTLMSKRHVVWITGASPGIGEVLAKQLANLGAKLIISPRNEAELVRVKKQLIGKHSPHGVKVLLLDLASACTGCNVFGAAHANHWLWLMDKIDGKRVEAAARKGNTCSLSLLFGRKKSS